MQLNVLNDLAEAMKALDGKKTVPQVCWSCCANRWPGWIVQSKESSVEMMNVWQWKWLVREAHHNRATEDGPHGAVPKEAPNGSYWGGCRWSDHRIWRRPLCISSLSEELHGRQWINDHRFQKVGSQLQEGSQSPNHLTIMQSCWRNPRTSSTHRERRRPCSRIQCAKVQGLPDSKVGTIDLAVVVHQKVDMQDVELSQAFKEKLARAQEDQVKGLFMSDTNSYGIRWLRSGHPSHLMWQLVWSTHGVQLSVQGKRVTILRNSTTVIPIQANALSLKKLGNRTCRRACNDQLMAVVALQVNHLWDHGMPLEKMLGLT